MTISELNVWERDVEMMFHQKDIGFWFEMCPSGTTRLNATTYCGKLFATSCSRAELNHIHALSHNSSRNFSNGTVLPIQHASLSLCSMEMCTYVRRVMFSFAILVYLPLCFRFLWPRVFTFTYSPMLKIDNFPIFRSVLSAGKVEKCSCADSEMFKRFLQLLVYRRHRRWGFDSNQQQMSLLCRMSNAKSLRCVELPRMRNTPKRISTRSEDSRRALSSKEREREGEKTNGQKMSDCIENWIWLWKATRLVYTHTHSGSVSTLLVKMKCFGVKENTFVCWRLSSFCCI